MSRTRRAQLVLAVAAGVVITGLTGTAFWLSYAHLAEVAGAHGLAGERQWAWPATLDAFIVAGELLMLLSALRGERSVWAIGLTVTGSAGSIVLNVAGVYEDGTPLLDYVVAGIPPAAALLAFGALMQQIHQLVAAGRNLPEPAVVPSEPQAVPVPELPELSAVETELTPFAELAVEAFESQWLRVFGDPIPTLELSPIPGGTGHDQQNPEPEPARGPHPEPVAFPVPELPEPTEVPKMPLPVRPVPPAGRGADDIKSEDTENTRFRKHVEQARNWLATDPTLSGSAIGTRLGTSDSYGRRVKRAVFGEGR